MTSGRRTWRVRRPGARGLLGWLIALALAGAAWFYLAPAALGGSTTYVVTDGISMLPRFHSGDLVLVRSQSSYRVGEIVAYHNTMLHTIVLHRIVGRDGSTYLFKGDHNNFVDPDHPRAGQLIGALWLHLAGAGRVLRSLSSPLAAGALVGFATLMLLGGAFTSRRRRRRRRAADGAQAPAPRRERHATPLGGLIAATLVAAIPVAALAALAFGTTTTALRPVSHTYRQQGAFSYSAVAQPGPVYPADRVTTGTPLFTRVVQAAQVRFAYAFVANGARQITGTIALRAILHSTSGWQQTFTLEPATRFHGEHAVASATLRLASLNSLIAAVESATSVSGQYTLTLSPQVSLTGAVSGRPLHTTYAPTLEFSLDRFEIEPIAGAAGAPGLTLHPSMAGAVTGRRIAPRTIPLGFAQPTVALARRIVFAAGATLAALLLIAFAAFGRRHPSESAAIKARYGHAIVDVARVKRRRKLALVDVADMAALAQIAERYDRLILHERNDDGEAYWVADESAQYRYAIAAPARGPGDHAGAASRWPLRRERHLIDVGRPAANPADVLALYARGGDPPGAQRSLLGDARN